jgi:predicted dehydrogenase
MPPVANRGIVRGNGLTRRRLLGGAALAGTVLWPSRRRAVGREPELRLGVIGIGSRGQELVRQFQRVPGVKITAACDVYPPRFQALAGITPGPVAAHADHRSLLEARNLDAVVVATPLHVHREHVTAALDAGYAVYGEKSIGLTVADCDAIRAAVVRTGRPFQVGHQYRYATWFNKAMARIRGGEIGTVGQIQAFWHRNHSWRRPVPAGPDGKVDPNLERLINWRLYRAYSGGLLAELGSHATDFANWLFQATPESVVGSGGIDFYRDGRETLDNVKAIFRYPGGQTFTFSALTNNAHMGFQVMIHGDRGTVILSQDDAVILKEKNLLAEPIHTRRKRDAVDTVTGASYRPGTETPGSPTVATIWRDRSGPHADVTHDACAAFCESLRTGKRIVADVQAGWASATAVALANKAVDEGRRIVFREHLEAG